jgi:hypothetical protein
MNAGLAGGIAGAVIGLAGGLVGAWAGIRNTKGPRERAFVLRAILLLWACMALFPNPTTGSSGRRTESCCPS